ncbi:MAG: hypothetical protein ACHQ49_05000 [Elusimicrobiota bacterium]
MKTTLALLFVLAATQAPAFADDCAAKISWNIGNREGLVGALIPSEAKVCVDKSGALSGVSYRRGDPGSGWTDWMYISREELFSLGFTLERTGLRPRDPNRKEYFFQKMIAADLIRRIAEVQLQRTEECVDTVQWWRDKRPDDLESPFITQPLAYVCVRKDGKFAGVSYDDNDNPPPETGYAGGFRYLTADDLSAEGYVITADGLRSRYSPDDRILFHGSEAETLLSNVYAVKLARPIGCVESLPWGLSTYGGGQPKAPNAYLCVGDHDRPSGVVYQQSQQPNRWIYESSGQISAKGWVLEKDDFTAFGGTCEGRYSDEAYERLIGRHGSCRVVSPQMREADLKAAKEWFAKQYPAP